MCPKALVCDGNTAVSRVAHYLSDAAILFPITPSTPAGENYDVMVGKGERNVFGQVPALHQLQSEAGVSGGLHGALLGGALATTFTSSQGLLLMIPNMYKIAGEMLPITLHNPTRAIGQQAQSIYCDYSDAMAVRSTGWCMMASNTVQEAQDLAAICHLSAIKGSLPFFHMYDGFRTSHSISKIDELPKEVMKDLLDVDAVKRFRERAMNPEHPVNFGVVAGTGTLFQSMEALNPYFERMPDLVQDYMDEFAKRTGRQYHLFDYVGHPEAESVVILMGSSASAAEEAIEYLSKKGEKVGVVKVHLFRPFSTKHLLAAIPKTCRKVAVLDRMKELGAKEPMYLDVVEAHADAGISRKIYGGVYGLGGKEFTPQHVAAVFNNLKKDKPLNHFSVGVEDDVTFRSLPLPEQIDAVPPSTKQCMFWGVGADGTVGANKDAIKIIGTNTPLHCQGAFAYDAKKSGGVTVSHLRFGKDPIKSEYYITAADYVACHASVYMEKFDMVSSLKENGIFMINSSWTSPEDFEKHCPPKVLRELAEKNAKLYSLDAVKIAKEVGLGPRTNQPLQAVFFVLSKVLPAEQAISLQKAAIKKTYSSKGMDIVEKNWAAVDRATKEFIEIKYDRKKWLGLKDKPVEVDMTKPKFVREWMEPVAALKGDSLKVSEQPIWSWPMGTTKYEKRGLAKNVPQWNAKKCVQCGACSFHCPHAVIRPYLATKDELKDAPASFETVKARGKKLKGLQYRIQISPEDCTGCGVCIKACPADALSFTPFDEVREVQKANYKFANALPIRRELVDKFSLKGQQFQEPLLEFSGACPGCAESPYATLLTRLFGDRAVIATASGCSVVWAGTAGFQAFTPSQDRGCGPAFGNSLFEDNAEFCYGLWAATDQRRKFLAETCYNILEHPAAGSLSSDVTTALKQWMENFMDYELSKVYGDVLRGLLHTGIESLTKNGELRALMHEILAQEDMLSKQSHWAVGGDGWAYDIGFGGLDHVIASGKNVNFLVFDNNQYANTGGQKSKATPLGAVAKFASTGTRQKSKDLGAIAMSYGHVYVAQIAMGADPAQTIKAFKEAESYDGPSVIIACCPCINWGIRKGMGESQIEQKYCVETGLWPLYRFDPRRVAEGKNPLMIDNAEVKRPLEEQLARENRYLQLKRNDPESYKALVEQLKSDIEFKIAKLHKLAE
ncbi:Pyruvate:ferredoxin oxidoreductase [Aduncisulcus paluster]|uniref:Pyruvate:ferredoxin oxidoreductase n=1 Tax=Aduncisulcus paluster TaxID=2918883 RepID=A0ABQ5KQZ2_9EUKA|nr:Pyruvate:ferredoxin oxidoreductase [Aduncisulcus paluster]|eukprot:gnl/Carplike_NY0171/438_a604_1901.p1 GENE.gnl/Carplike_NY0171/438_a604_1901~~gnl/Carplike_NY0171/438_a604_1901.p1  ORF type:complete len:1180 (-),score=468.83 gnl/Carplike_NY0171/438_a604_1901:62-3601(-)